MLPHLVHDCKCCVKVITIHKAVQTFSCRSKFSKLRAKSNVDEHLMSRTDVSMKIDRACQKIKFTLAWYGPNTIHPPIENPMNMKKAQARNFKTVGVAFLSVTMNIFNN